MKSIDLYMIVGFLGSGKTTFLKNFLKDFEKNKIAVVMNDFGKQNIDAKLVTNEIIDLKEISNGSLFCSCKSDHFVSTITDLSQKNFDIIVVESSGMANPSTLLNVFDLVQSKVHKPIHFKGTIGLIDASKIDKLIHLANMVPQQIAHSDLLLLNKIDLVNEYKLSIIIDLIKMYNEIAPLYEVKDATIPKSILKKLQIIEYKKLIPNKIDLNTQKCLISLKNIVNMIKLELFLIDLEKEVHRIKGFVYKDDSCYFIECVNGEVQYCLHEDNNQKPYLVVISIMKKNLDDLVLETWNKHFSTHCNII